MRTVRRQARTAGLLYLLVGVTAPIGLLYVPGKLVVTGFLLLLGGVGYVVDSAATLLLPAAANVTATVMMFLGLSELVMMLWLVIWGAVGPSAGDPVDLPATAS